MTARDTPHDAPRDDARDTADGTTDGTARGTARGHGISVTHDLEAHDWSNEETAAYEAAIEAVNGAVGAYSAQIAAEEAKSTPDAAVIEAARAAQGRLAKERERLRSADREQIAEARARYARLAREVLASLA
ncbi:hypothetical protein [Streptomyces sp. VNUA24]|uniref:hypothetical protein n=1 Tax=Streptomyces sp. VNUA24 TaxID=3031131 RepID=UPI0023B77AE1|nr:hypothetical protein [Streptomyces sp. VNUA24]WEH16363.1 hypothetical protein PYR72_22655 [Streptomyces sp. VNUA24]